MGFLDNYRVNKAITTLLAAPDGTSPEAVQAVSTLKRMGQAAIPKLIEALGKAHHPRVLIALLETCVQNATLPRDVNPSIPNALEAIIMQAMAVEPDKRFQSMDALEKQLAPLLKQYAR